MKFDKRIIIVFNPVGGSADEATLLRLQHALEITCRTEVLCLPTKAKASQTRAELRLAMAGASLIVAMGGDGTARIVAETVGNDVPMAVFPGGTGNLFARTFANYPDPWQFATMLANGSVQPIDLMEAEYTPEGSTEPQKRLILVSLDFGKLSDAIAETDRTWKRWLGSIAYAFNVIRASFNPSEHEVTFKNLDGSSLGSGFENVPISAAFLLNVAPPHLINISRGCNASDGRLDLVVLRATRVWELATAALWLGFGKPDRSRHYSRRRLQDVVVTSRKPMKVNFDGDCGGTTSSVTVRTLPGAVQMILA
jgi:diacylglycerol kinase (ATP)